jgi:hypothetical protein
VLRGEVTLCGEVTSYDAPSLTRLLGFLSRVRLSQDLNLRNLFCVELAYHCRDENAM